MFTNVMPIVRKELKSYFNSPVAYIVVVAFLVFTSVWFFFLQSFFAQNTASLRSLFGVMPIVFVMLLPAISMRSWAEEKKMGTVEVLLTLPFREGDLVLGKFLGAFALLVLTVLLTLPIPLMVGQFGRFDWGQVFGQYLGVLLMGAAGLSLGLFVSSFTTNQLSSFVIAALAMLLFTLIGSLNSLADLPIWLASTVNWFSFVHHFESFGKGLIDTRDLFFFLIFTSFFLYLNIKSLVFKKW